MTHVGGIAMVAVMLIGVIYPLWSPIMGSEVLSVGVLRYCSDYGVLRIRYSG